MFKLIIFFIKLIFQYILTVIIDYFIIFILLFFVNSETKNMQNEKIYEYFIKLKFKI